MNKNKRQLTWLKKMRTKAASATASTRITKDGNASLPASSPLTPSSNTFHHSCSTLTVDRFQNILLTDDLQFLIIKGEPTPEQLLAAWQLIIDEYAELMQAERYNNVFELTKQIEGTRTKIHFVAEALQYLKAKYDFEVAESLTLHGYSMIEDLADRKDYLGQIYRVETEAKYLIILLNQFLTEYKILKDDDPDDTTGKMTKADYEKEAGILSRYQGYRIRREQTTVAEYIGITKSYMDFHKAQKKVNG